VTDETFTTPMASLGGKNQLVWQTRGAKQTLRQFIKASAWQTAACLGGNQTHP